MEPDLHIVDLLASPLDYHNRRLRVAGVYMRFHENQCLDGTPPDDPDIEYDPDEKLARIWLETDENTQWIGIARHYGRYVPAIVEGVYRHGECGHCGRYEGQLTEISVVTAASAS